MGRKILVVTQVFRICITFNGLNLHIIHYIKIRTISDSGGHNLCQKGILERNCYLKLKRKSSYYCIKIQKFLTYLILYHIKIL